MGCNSMKKKYETSTMEKIRVEFEKNYYNTTIPEDRQILTLVLTVKLKTSHIFKRSEVSYSILYGNADNCFKIDPKNGRIRVNCKLDYERKKKYHLTVMGRVDNLYDRTKVVVNIENINEPPIYETSLNQIIELNENDTLYDDDVSSMINNGKCIAKIIAYDPDIVDKNDDQHIVFDLDPSNQIFYKKGLLDDYSKNKKTKLFSVDRLSGCLTMAKPFYSFDEFYSVNNGQDNYYFIWSTTVKISDNDGLENSRYSFVKFHIVAQKLNSDLNIIIQV